MDESDFHLYKKCQTSGLGGHPETKSQHVLQAEERILQAICGGAPVPETLNEICATLDRQIGNIVSLISMVGERTTSPTAIARTAALFGLHVFSTEKIFGDFGEELGSLEMYCCVPRAPSRNEVRLIERARQLAALAFEREASTSCRTDDRARENGSMLGRVLEEPELLN
jgi:hypothetical protein